MGIIVKTNGILLLIYLYFLIFAYGQRLHSLVVLKLIVFNI